MRVKLLIDLQGAVNGKKGDIVPTDEETGRMLIAFMLVEKVVYQYRPKYKPIIVHTRCIKEQK